MRARSLAWRRDPDPGGSLPVASSTLVRLRALRTDLGPRAARCHSVIGSRIGGAVGKPRVVPDEDHEVVYERVAAVDVAKASGVVCMRLPDPARPGRYSNQIWDNVPAARARITELGRELLRHQVQMVTLESTSDYWRIWYYVLESIGLAVQLVSASQARNLKGRPKTDKLDAMWLARLTQWGMLRPSFVPPAAIRQVRDFTRARTDRSTSGPGSCSGWRSCSKTPW